MGANLSKALSGYSDPCNAVVVLTPWHPGRLFGNKEMRLLMLGLDAAGKTSWSPLQSF